MKIEKCENMKTVRLDRTHQEDVSEISQISTQTLLMISSQPTPHLSSMASSVPTSMQQPVSQSPRIHQASKWSPHVLHKHRKHEHQDQN